MELPLIKKVDCVLLHVHDLESGIRFYGDVLGHKLKWRTQNSAGFQMADSDSEIVIQTSRREQETDLLVESVDSDVKLLEDAGSKVRKRPFDIQVGRCAVVDDPWENRLVLIDLSKGILVTDSDGNVVGNKRQDQ